MRVACETPAIPGQGCFGWVRIDIGRVISSLEHIFPCGGLRSAILPSNHVDGPKGLELSWNWI